MSIWYQPVKLEDIHHFKKDTMVETLGIEFTELGEDFIRGRMPVDHRTHQPYGILHGGASIALAETLGSIASHLCIDSKKYKSVGLEINGNHIRQVRSGFVYGTARPIHIGRKTHIWEIRIENEEGKLVCLSRLTVAIVEG